MGLKYLPNLPIKHLKAYYCLMLNYSALENSWFSVKLFIFIIQDNFIPEYFKLKIYWLIFHIV